VCCQLGEAALPDGGQPGREGGLKRKQRTKQGQHLKIQGRGTCTRDGADIEERLPGREGGLEDGPAQQAGTWFQGILQGRW
jgi:hypothetical protein